MNDFEYALKKLFPRRRSNQVKNHIDANCLNDLNVFAPFTHKSFKRSFIKESKFINSEITFSAWTGTRYESIIFQHSIIRNCNMQSCVFLDCTLTNFVEQLKNTTFDDTLFINTKFEKVDFKGCNFTNARFINCEFISCRFISSNFDGATFIECKLNGVIARNLNLDFAQFKNCEIYNSEFSLFQIFYTIGLTQLLNDNCSIDRWTQCKLAFHGSNLNYNELVSEYIMYLKTYYTEMGEYFPLANIYGLCKDVENFKEYAILGIKNAVATKKFRLAIHFSELINYYGYLRSIEKRFIVDSMNGMLNEWQQEEDITEYLKYITIIEKNLLYENLNRPVVYVNIRTEEQLNEQDLSEFLLLADTGFTDLQGGDGEHFISFSHNSPTFFEILLAIGGSVAGSAIYEGVKCLLKKFYKWIKSKGNKVSKSSIKQIGENQETKYTEYQNNIEDDD